jgi:phospholipid/cholesterol/gamma-HCH transport system ATP-binding protein
MISLKDVAVSFDGRVVLDGISLHVPEGSTLVLLGKNGSGKSVILKAIAGLIDVREGALSINGIDVRDFFSRRGRFGGEKDEDFRLAYVFQKGGLFDSMNVLDNVAFGLRRMGLGEERAGERALAAITRVGLSGSEAKLPSELSGGMQKRVGLARAVCLEPRVILYDDPTAGLDPVLSDSIADLITEIRNSFRSTSIVVTHDLQVARKVADSIALIYNGKIVFYGSGADFFSGSDPYARQFIEGDIEGPIDIF